SSFATNITIPSDIRNFAMPVNGLPCFSFMVTDLILASKILMLVQSVLLISGRERINTGEQRRKQAVLLFCS
ncbi:MAG TPA: hypothetical protein PKK93_08290, partial [Bacteroidales bacterium]|nr:hypothetical protein [Bacteroidales bacterium]